ncbi:MAG TPA: transglutaminase-like cysteine peptidase [Bradyrhizobium sp.]|uniref:transglutaminase-like cysteine peptidase n=1 Tax=Bradyrhizobium sp. TaxID=376 RepID=UPI002D7FFB00|nr:transglutaminase-like cysteine peptidase [Bradyrhizobium sp.]HET7889773.1 transglutaminase-like cysteine peptidase [Bradyrhizobium sp.]
MGAFNISRPLRAIALAIGLTCLWPAVLNAGTLISPGTLDVIRKSAEPFGLFATRQSAGGLAEKWNGLARKLEDDMVQLALCDGDRERCVSAPALQFLAIVDVARGREGRARLGEINRAINLAIKATSDMAQHGQIDVWSPPLATFASGAGDCEDYAIAKFAALRMAGLSPEDLRIVVLRDQVRGEDHAAALARLDGHWLMLDNRRMAMIEDIDVKGHRPLFVIGDDGVMRYQEPPSVATLAGGTSAPATAVKFAVPVDVASRSN